MELKIDNKADQNMVLVNKLPEQKKKIKSNLRNNMSRRISTKKRFKKRFKI